MIGLNEAKLSYNIEYAVFKAVNVTNIVRKMHTCWNSQETHILLFRTRVIHALFYD